MKTKISKAVRIITITVGSLLLANAFYLTFASNFNIGLIPVYALGFVLTLYGMFFEKLRHIKIIHILLCSGLSVLLVFGSFLAIYGSNDNADYTEQTVIVLGCGIRGEKVTVSLAKRLDKAFEYYQKNPDVTIIVSGGQGAQEDIPEALAMKRYLAEKGIDEDKIVMEDNSDSTITNFANSHEIMDELGLKSDSVVFITNAYHIYRAETYAKAEGLEVTHLGTDIKLYTVPMNYMREMIAVIKMWLVDL